MKRTRHRTHHDGPLATATLALEGAVTALCAPQTAQTPTGRTVRLDSRYTMLVDAVGGDQSTSGHRHGLNTAIPAWIDALKLKLKIDTRTAQLAATIANTLTATTDERLQQITQHRWRPQDSKHIEAIAGELAAFAKEIDDLFTVPPIPLFDPHKKPIEWARCPQCGHKDTELQHDDAEPKRSPALLLTIERGAWCTHCHKTWVGDQQIRMLARMLGHPAPAGVVA